MISVDMALITKILIFAIGLVGVHYLGSFLEEVRLTRKYLNVANEKKKPKAKVKETLRHFFKENYPNFVEYEKSLKEQRGITFINQDKEKTQLISFQISKWGNKLWVEYKEAKGFPTYPHVFDRIGSYQYYS